MSSITQFLKSKALLIPTSLTLILVIFTFLLNHNNPFTPFTSTFLPSLIGAQTGLVPIKNGSNSNTSCDIFDGRWVHDKSYPIYPPGSCPFIDKFSCFDHGRSDLGYLSYRWQPRGCDIPRFDGVKMLEMLRGKRLVFVGDSLNRNMCLALICALSNHTKITKLEEPKDLYAFKVMDYNCSITNIEAPFLADRDMQRGTLRLDKIEHKASEYYDADFLIFNTGRWWNPSKAKRGENFFQEGDFVHSKMDLGEAYGKALNTWAKWVDGNVNKNKTRVFFSGISAAHFSGGQWNSGGNCNGETEPITNTTLLTRYPRLMRTLESVISNMSTPVTYLNITRMTGYRKDAHPSIYWQSKTDRRPRMHQDCTHWCIPGVPDSWNQLLIINIGAPFLVDRDMQQGTVRLDKIEHEASEYYDADFLIFNTGHWWNHTKAKRGENFFQEGDFVHSKLDLEEAYGKALNTWAKWVDRNVNKNRTRVIFAGFSASHFSGGRWNSGGNCNGETEPITNTTLVTPYARMMRTLESVISNMSTPIIYLNITQMTGYRKDAHPSIY